METIQIFGYVGALTVGLILGLVGSGGSLIAIPIFTYMFHISPVTTTAYSLFVVGSSASIGTWRNWKKKQIDYRTATVFAIPSFIAIYAARKYLLPTIPLEIMTIEGWVVTKDMAIMVLLAITMFFSAISMLRKTKRSINGRSRDQYNYPLMALQGALIGLFTGIVGIGGGFLIIPALVLLVKLPMKKAVATTMFIIAVKSFIGFLGDIQNLEIHWGFLLGFSLISILGTYLGIYLSSFIDGKTLKKSFAWMVLAISIGIFCIELL